MSTEQHRERRRKVETLRERGIDPYPVGFEQTAEAGDLHARFGDLAPETSTGETVSVAGRLMGKRDLGKLSFGVLQDRSGRIQLFADKGTLGDELAAFVDLDLGDLLGVTGEVITTKKGELSVRVHEFSLLAKSLWPLPEKWHGLADVETRYRQRYLDLIANEEARRVFGVRAGVLRGLRRAFEDRGYVEVETPVLQNQAGGALATPFLTHHNALDIDMYLRIALELHLKRLIIGGIDKVFEIGRVFRNEGVSPQHNPEFTMLESYEAYADYDDIMALVEETVAGVATDVVGSTTVEYRGRPIDLAPPWKRAPFMELINEATGREWDPDMAVDDARAVAAELGVDVEVGGTGKVLEELFERFVEPDLWDPTFVIDFPKEISPFARDHRSKPGLVERFEGFLAGIEFCNAFTELNDPEEQLRRFEVQAQARAQGDEEAHVTDLDFVEAMEYGMPPTGGLGIGVDRLAMLLADVATVREVILFPHMRPGD
ncbi:MAG: lysine--tRNA ligase [Acidimicrobiia bacterium]|nr:lysine--tRNA ligase [Acidimicrobiia bacterium]NNF88956.1 lysine--tRNA ligase [Acidimicrobiia bacterium]